MIRQNNSNVQDRLKAFLEHLKISNSEFGRRIGVSNAYVTSIRKSIQPDKLEKISKEFPNLNIKWLITGEGAMLQTDEGPVCEEKNVIRYWRDIEATGGGLVSFDDIKSDYTSYVLPDFRDCTDAVNIVGESMEPLYKSGSIILLKEWTENFIDYGNPYLIITKNGNRMVKILRSVDGRPDVVRCESKNPDYDPFDIEKADILRLYVVKGSISKNVM